MFITPTTWGQPVFLPELRSPGLRFASGSRQQSGGKQGPCARQLVKSSGEPLRVLVVEDEAMVAALLQEIIMEAGGEVVGTISSGLASVGAAAVTRPDVIVMDIGLPGMDGIDAAAIIRARYAIPSVLISGKDSGAQIAERLGHVRIAYVKKPIQADELCEALIEAYESRDPPSPREA